MASSQIQIRKNPGAHNSWDETIRKLLSAQLKHETNDIASVCEGGGGLERRAKQGKD